ncbi:Transmembrane protein [Parasponia andersonii]|uniref:Transmembrane protein n=1 Tax=Parasponia andersonii TaxID=3476 RepID=A0A2P5CJS1_PARAD|nr:Transmembrane protein [Parasponia andersonii]
MGSFKLLLLLLYTYAAVILLHVPNSVESTVLIRFGQTPPPRSRYSYAVFRYSFETLDGSSACLNTTCSIHCQLDGQALSPCPAKVQVLKNLAVNRDHKFLLNVTTWNGETNSSAYSWFIDTIPPTATISTKQNYTNAKRIAIDVKFSEPCIGRGGFKCVNSSDCDVIIKGPAHINPTSLRIINPATHYKLDVVFPMKSTVGRVVIGIADNICTDQAGNNFTRTNGSSIIIHFDRGPLLVDFWTAVPSYELVINGVPRTVLATNKIEDLKIFLAFNIPVGNTTEQILNALRVNRGSLVHINGTNQGNRRFAFELNVTARTEIITVELQSHLIIGRTGTPVSPAPSITFVYDLMEPGVRLSTNSPNVTKEPHINIIVEFTKPVFGFEVSMVNVTGGIITGLKELSKALYSMNVLAAAHNIVSVSIPAGKVNDISGNLNLESNKLEVKHYSIPPLSIALHSFVTAGILATSFATAVLSLSFANLGAIDTLASGSANIVAIDPSKNLHGMVGHLQVFVLSDWLSVNQPIEYSETAKGLRWLIPHQKLPWKKDSASVWPNHIYLAEEELATKLSNIPEGWPLNKKTSDAIDSCLTNISCARLKDIEPKPGWLYGQHNVSNKKAPYGLALDSKEYFIYFLRGEPLSARDVVKKMENYKGWQDLEMNLFWLGMGGGSLVIAHVLLLLFLKWRTRTPIHGILSVPRFELFLLILMLPCISQSSAFVIRGGTNGGIITGALLLAIPAAFILSIILFLIIAVFSGSLVQYKEIKHVASTEPWYAKLWLFCTTKTIKGKWFYREGLPSSFVSRFGILFENLKGPPLFVFVDQNDSNTTHKWGGSGQDGTGRIRAVSSDDSNEENEIPLPRRLLGCARSSYLVIDILRRVSLGIIAGAYSSKKLSQSIFALTVTLVQFMYLFILKPFISKGVQLVESVSLLCEIGLFGISISMTSRNPMEAQKLGYVMLTLLFITFVTQIIHEWYTLLSSLLRLSHPQKNSLKLGLKFAAKGLVLPFLSRKHRSGVTPSSKTGLLHGLPLSPETELRRRDRKPPFIDPIVSMTATVVPALSPGSPIPGVTQRIDSMTVERNVSWQITGEGKQPKGLELESKSEMKKLRALARASFSGDSNVKEASTSYTYRE